MQFPDKKVVTPILNKSVFYPIKDDEIYHQDCYKNNPIRYTLTATQNPPPRPPTQSTNKQLDTDSKSPTLATDSEGNIVDYPSPRSSSQNRSKIVHSAKSACDPHREWIEKQVGLGRNGVSIYQDLVERYGFTHKYNSVKRFVRGIAPVCLFNNS